MWSKEKYESVSGIILNSGIEVHKAFGPGLLESVYQFGFIKELELNGIKVQSQVPVPLFYKGFDTGKLFYIDLLIEDRIIIEIKASEGILPVHEAQLVSYMKPADKRLGFLINFNVPLLKDGFRRKVNNYFL